MKEERLKHVADIRVSNVDKKSSEGDAQVRLCNYTDVYYNERISGDLNFMTATATPDQRTTFGLRQNDVVLTKDSETADDIGVSALVTHEVPDLVCGYHLAVVRADTKRVLGGYLRWVLTSQPARQRMSASATGVTRFGLRSDAIADLPIPIPSLPTQYAVVDYLDRETARIDALIAAKRRMAELLEERWQGAAQIALRGGVSSSASWSPGPTWLGSVPKSWVPRKIAWHKVTGSGTTPASDRESYYTKDGGVPWVTTAELRERDITSTSRQITTEALQDYSALRVFPSGTLLIAMYGATVGRLGILRISATVNQACCAIAPGGHLDQGFLYWWMRTFRSDLVDLAYGAGQPNISQETIRSLRIPAPAIDEQREIARSLANYRSSVDKGLEVLGRQIDLLQERRQALITAAVTGQLDIPEAA